MRGRSVGWKFNAPAHPISVCCLHLQGCQCCLWCLEKVLKYVNKNAYIECSIHVKFNDVGIIFWLLCWGVFLHRCYFDPFLPVPSRSLPAMVLLWGKRVIDIGPFGVRY